MGYKIKAQYHGYISYLEGNDITFCLENPITKEEIICDMNKSDIYPASEQKWVCNGAYVTVTVRRKVTFKFYKKMITRRKWSRAIRNVRRKYGDWLDWFKDDERTKTVEL